MLSLRACEDGKFIQWTVNLKMINLNGSPNLLPLKGRHTWLVPWRVYTKGLVAGTCPTNLRLTRSVSVRNKSKRLVPKIQTGLNSWEYSQRLTLVPATRFWSKDGQFSRWDLSPRLVTGTGSLLCAVLKGCTMTNSPHELSPKSPMHLASV